MIQNDILYTKKHDTILFIQQEHKGKEDFDYLQETPHRLNYFVLLASATLAQVGNFESSNLLQAHSTTNNWRDCYSQSMTRNVMEW